MSKYHAKADSWITVDEVSNRCIAKLSRNYKVVHMYVILTTKKLYKLYRNAERKIKSAFKYSYEEQHGASLE